MPVRLPRDARCRVTHLRLLTVAWDLQMFGSSRNHQSAMTSRQDARTTILTATATLRAPMQRAVCFSILTLQTLPTHQAEGPKDNHRRHGGSHPTRAGALFLPPILKPERSGAEEPVIRELCSGRRAHAAPPQCYPEPE